MISYKLFTETVLTLGHKITTTDFHHEPTGSRAALINRGPRTATLTGVETRPEHRGKGGAHEVMKKVTAHLDLHGMNASLHAIPTDEKGAKKSSLVKFYSKHGFVHHGDGYMTREPRGD